MVVVAVAVVASVVVVVVVMVVVVVAAADKDGLDVYERKGARRKGEAALDVFVVFLVIHH